jgi:hypothetical protein
MPPHACPVPSEGGSPGPGLRARVEPPSPPPVPLLVFRGAPSVGRTPDLKDGIAVVLLPAKVPNSGPRNTCFVCEKHATIAFPRSSHITEIVRFGEGCRGTGQGDVRSPVPVWTGALLPPDPPHARTRAQGSLSPAKRQVCSFMDGRGARGPRPGRVFYHPAPGPSVLSVHAPWAEMTRGLTPKPLENLTFPHIARFPSGKGGRPGVFGRPLCPRNLARSVHRKGSSPCKPALLGCMVSELLI